MDILIQGRSNTHFTPVFERKNGNLRRRMTEYTKLSDEELVELFRQEGDVKAFEQLMLRYEKPIYNFILRMVGDPQRSSDLFQEVFLKVYQKIESFQNKAAFSPWLYKIAKHQCIDEFRRYENRFKPASLEQERETGSLQDKLSDDSFTPEDLMFQQELGQRIAEAVKQVPERYRTVFILHRYQSLPYHEIAEIEGVPVGTVKSRMFEATRRLRVLLKDLKEL